VEQLLRDGLAFVLEEPAATAWFAVRFGPTTFGIVDASPDEIGRQAHLAGRLAPALLARASDLLAHSPTIEPVDVPRVQAAGLSAHREYSPRGGDIYSVTVVRCGKEDST